MNPSCPSRVGIEAGGVVEAVEKGGCSESSVQLSGIDDRGDVLPVPDQLHHGVPEGGRVVGTVPVRVLVDQQVVDVLLVIREHVLDVCSGDLKIADVTP